MTLGRKGETSAASTGTIDERQVKRRKYELCGEISELDDIQFNDIKNGSDDESISATYSGTNEVSSSTVKRDDVSNSQCPFHESEYDDHEHER